jgi:hypothetical protein
MVLDKLYLKLCVKPKKFKSQVIFYLFNTRFHEVPSTRVKWNFSGDLEYYDFSLLNVIEFPEF